MRRGREKIDFLFTYVSSFIRVSEVFVTDKATKTFSFVAFFVEALIILELSLYVRRYEECQMAR
jgi:hypothetical protein